MVISHLKLSISQIFEELFANQLSQLFNEIHVHIDTANYLKWDRQNYSVPLCAVLTRSEIKYFAILQGEYKQYFYLLFKGLETFSHGMQ